MTREANKGLLTYGLKAAGEPRRSQKAENMKHALAGFMTAIAVAGGVSGMYIRSLQ